MSASPWLLIAITVAITFAVTMFGILLWRRFSDGRAEGREYEMRVTPYVRRPIVLSPTEQSLYTRLNQACGPEYIVCPKVHLPDAIEVRGDAMEWQRAWNRIAAKHLDFLLVASGSFAPLLAVELEDTGDRQRVDELMERALVAAGLPVLRIRARGDYDPIWLRQQMDAKLRTVK